MKEASGDGPHIFYQNMGQRNIRPHIFYQNMLQRNIRPHIFDQNMDMQIIAVKHWNKLLETREIKLKEIKLLQGKAR